MPYDTTRHRLVYVAIVHMGCCPVIKGLRFNKNKSKGFMVCSNALICLLFRKKKFTKIYLRELSEMCHFSLTYQSSRVASRRITSRHVESSFPITITFFFIAGVDHVH